MNKGLSAERSRINVEINQGHTIMMEGLAAKAVQKIFFVTPPPKYFAVPLPPLLPSQRFIYL